jgi:hypothetical protein
MRGLSGIGSFSLLFATLLACGGGVGAGGNGALQPFAISAAANPATAADVHNLLEPRDRYRFEPNNGAANAILDNLWTQLTAFNAWTGGNPLNTYRFYNDSDPLTHWGRAYRFTGFAQYAGPIRPFTAGTYTRENGSSYPALILQTWDGTYAEILVLLGPNTFVHANQNVNGLPITETFTAR